MKTFTLFLSLVLACAAYTQEWTTVNPNPSSYSYNSLHVGDGGKGIFVGPNGLISKTEDFGDSFRVIFSETNHTLNSIDSPTDGMFTAVGDNGNIIRSVNEGENWNIINTNFSGKLNEVKYFDETVGVIVGEGGTVLRTSDAGITWKEIDLGVTNNFTNLLVVNESVGFIWSKLSQSFFRTTDGGINWTQIDVNLGWNLNSLYFSDANKGKIFLQESVTRGHIYTSSDGGQTWAEMSQTTNRNFVSTYFLNENIGFGTTATNFVFRTQDGGLTWESEEALAFHGTKIKGNNSVIYNLRQGDIVRSVDSGLTGEVITSKLTSEDLRKVIFDKNNDIYLAGGSHPIGTVLKSKDGGNSFSILEAEWPRTILDFIGLVNNNLIAIGESSSITLSNDGGETWEKKFLISSGGLTSITAVENFVWVLASEGKVMKSNDYGDSWSLIYENPEVETRSPNYITFINELEGFITYRESKDLSYTLDGGLSWEKHVLPNFAPSTCLQFFDENTAYFASDHLYKTVDKGATWEIINSEMPTSPNIMYFRNDEVGYLTDINRNIWKTEDGGESWFQQVAYFGGWTQSMIFNEEGLGIVVGRNGLILRIEEGSLSSSQVEEVMKLPNMVIFPNPAAHEIHLPSGNFTERSVLNIYSMDGNLISEIKGNQQGQPIHVSHLPTGMYILLHSNGEVLEKGMFVKQ